jgi:integrase
MGVQSAADVDTAAVMQVLTPIWNQKPETASRVRGRIEVTLDATKFEGLRSSGNPARWAGHLKFLLPSKKKVRRCRHSWRRYVSGKACRRALELCILTASRSGEIIGMDWREVDLGNGVWTVPPERMKASREHRVPLVGRTLDILKVPL